MATTNVLTKLKSGIRRLVGNKPAKKEWPFQDEKINYIVDERVLSRLSPAVIDVQARVVPELQAIAYTPEQASQGFESMIYRNRLEQMYERLRKAKKDTFTLHEAQALSGLETDLRASVAHLIDKGFVVKTNNRRPSKLYTGKPGRPTVSERLHTEYKIVKSRWYVGQRTGYGSVADWS